MGGGVTGPYLYRLGKGGMLYLSRWGWGGGEQNSPLQVGEGGHALLLKRGGGDRAYLYRFGERGMIYLLRGGGGGRINLYRLGTGGML